MIGTREQRLRFQNTYIMVGDTAMFVCEIHEGRWVCNDKEEKMYTIPIRDDTPEYIRHKPVRTGLVIDPRYGICHATRIPGRNYKYGITHEYWDVERMINNKKGIMTHDIAERVLSPTCEYGRVLDVLEDRAEAALLSDKMGVFREGDDIIILYDKYRIGKIVSPVRAEVAMEAYCVDYNIRKHFEEITYA